jgi:tetratricopeptide (TPR) repeat protein
MTEQEQYWWRTEQIEVFLDDDNRFAHSVPPRRRLRYAGRAVNGAEAYLSRVDPMLSVVRARYADALYRVDPRSRRLRDLIGMVIREACVALGPDHDLIAELRRVQSGLLTIGGVRSAHRKIDRAVQRAAELRENGTDREYLSAMYRLADRYEAAGRYTDLIRTYDTLISERDRLDLGEDRLNILVYYIGNALLDHGEIARALPLLKGLREKMFERLAGSDSILDVYELANLERSVADCHLANREARKAETVLRECAERLARQEREKHYRHVHRLRHRIVLELGTALLLQARVRDALARYEEACDLLDGFGIPDEKDVRAYRNARIYASTMAPYELV